MGLAVSRLIGVQAGFAAPDLTSKPPNQHEHDNDDQDGADDADATVSVAILISTEAATEVPSRKMSRTITRMSPSDMIFSPYYFAVSLMPRRMLSKTAHK